MNTSQVALVKACAAFGTLNYGETEGGSWLTWKRDDRDVPTGTLVAFAASWVAGKASSILVQRRGGYPVLSGYRDLVAELKTGVKKETGEDVVKNILGAIYHHTEKAKA